MIENKTMLNEQELIEHLKEKNIKFNYMSELQAINYLENYNNYYNVISYKNNFEKYYINNTFVDKYTNLDFSYLCDLSRIDYELRILLFEMISNIEHHLKLRILKIIKNIDDGYNLVNLYLNKDYNDNINPKRLHKSIYNKTGSIYYKKVFEKYDIDEDKKLENIPIWEFLEIITFGELIGFYDFIVKKYNLKEEVKYEFMLRDVGRLRNAVYHNTNILTDLEIKDNNYPIPKQIISFINKCNLGKKTISQKFKNSRIRQVTCALYIFKELVNNIDIQNTMNKRITNFIKIRILLNKEYYNNNELLKSVYDYFLKIIEKYFI